MLLNMAISLLAIASFAIGSILIIGIIAGLYQGNFHIVTLSIPRVIIASILIILFSKISIFLVSEGWNLSAGLLGSGILLLVIIDRNGIENAN